MTTFFMLIGLPGTGKSTWADRYIDEHGLDNDVTVISTDNTIEMIAKQHRLTYNDVFNNDTYVFAETISYKMAKIVFARNDIVIWDQTNLTVKSRKKKLDIVPSYYKKIAVAFSVPHNLDQRLANRPDKKIPDVVMSNMKKSYQEPKFVEGFDVILSGNF